MPFFLFLRWKPPWLIHELLGLPRIQELAAQKLIKTLPSPSASQSQRHVTAFPLFLHLKVSETGLLMLGYHNTPVGELMSYSLFWINLCVKRINFCGLYCAISGLYCAIDQMCSFVLHHCDHDGEDWSCSPPYHGSSLEYLLPHHARFLLRK